MHPCANIYGLLVGTLIARHEAPRAVQSVSLRGRHGPRTPRCSATIGRASVDKLAALLTGLCASAHAAGPTKWCLDGAHRGSTESLVRALDSSIDGAPTMIGGQGGPQDDAREAPQLGHSGASGAHTRQGAGHGVGRPSLVALHAS